MGEYLLWIGMAALTALTVTAVVAPLLRPPRAQAADDGAIYRDQLETLAGEQARGLVTSGEADSARAEIGRRLLAAVNRPGDAAVPAARDRRPLARLLVLATPAPALALYLTVGSPGLPAQPLGARLAAPPASGDAAALVARAEAELGRHPDRPDGWQVMAPIYMRLGRFADAAGAYSKLMRLAGATAERETMFGVALVGQAGGIVTADARRAFERALKLDPGYGQAHISRALSREQDGDAAGAVAELREVLAGTPAADPLAAAVRREIARMEAALPPGPSRADMADAAGMTAEQRGGMVRGMVAGLQSRLDAGGGGIDEWLRLVRSYAVLGDPDKAKGAADRARRSYAADPEALARIDALAASLGLRS